VTASPDPLPAPASGPKAGVAFFDFDGTLVRGDSLLPFLAEVVGRSRARLSLLRAMRIATQIHARGRQLGQDLRTSIKAVLLRETLTGIPLAEAQAAAERLAGWPRWNARMVEAL
jgi:phosphoserine phosphatase